MAEIHIPPQDLQVTKSPPEVQPTLSELEMKLQKLTPSAAAAAKLEIDEFPWLKNIAWNVNNNAYPSPQYGEDGPSYRHSEAEYSRMLSLPTFKDTTLEALQEKKGEFIDYIFKQLRKQIDGFNDLSDEQKKDLFVAFIVLHEIGHAVHFSSLSPEEAKKIKAAKLKFTDKTRGRTYIPRWLKYRILPDEKFADQFGIQRVISNWKVLLGNP